MEEALENGFPSESEDTSPLLHKEWQHTDDGSLDIYGRPALRHKSGNWRASAIILGVEVLESLAYYAIATNLVMYMSKILHEGNASIAASVSTWMGTGYLTPFLGALVADSYWGRYWTIFISALIYLLGMVILTISASISFLKPPQCEGSSCPSATEAQKLVFFSGLNLIAFGGGGIKSSLLPLGADQFEEGNPVEKQRKGSFFNWFYFTLNLGALISSTFIIWIEDNINWAVGFGIATLFMALAVVGFISGTWIYRLQRPSESSVKRGLQVLVASLKKTSLEVPVDSSDLYEMQGKTSMALGSQKLVHTDEFRFLDKAATMTALDVKNDGSPIPWRLCTVTQVEELKILLRLLPIWLTSIVYFTGYSQMCTTFIEQGSVMDAAMGPFSVPPASLFAFEILSVMILVLIYDTFIVSTIKWFVGKGSGLSELQRMGVGRFLIILAMSAAALVERMRLKRICAGESMSIAWQLPQYFILGASEVFNCIGQLEFFYGQAPDTMRSMFIAFSLLTNSFGSYLSSFIVTAVASATSGEGQPGWIPDDLNVGHLDYFFWALAGLSAFNFGIFIVFARRYRLKKVMVEH
ncbi:protein NRT1/ PTR FAMILY 8.3-like isoform X1 [Magnolia sinica]|uniref:protein NRT1/ PTR FAMILY 8.3-like isoform X1 n=2 Tax=Magnolia sinica TaxID=86752 RepID=UPI00265AD3A4|nr:protein NRT1/ PTR FAMILY 8.3-like isoform X1 [Magnolia sinica]